MSSTFNRVAYRYVSGRPLDGRHGYAYLTAGAGRWPGWKRQVYRLGVPAAAVVTLADPTGVERVGAVTVAVVAYRVRRRFAQRRFTREYIAPTLAAIGPPLGGVKVRLHVDPGLGNLTPRLAKPLSPAEERIRRVYGRRVEPVIRWPGNLVLRGVWWVQRVARPVTVPIGAALRRPGERPGPRIELVADTAYLTSEQRKLVSSIVGAKIPVADLVETWDQVGARVTATWTVRRRPPTRVGVDEIRAGMEPLDEWQFYVGAGSDNRPVTISLREDSPHIAVSAGSGAGKSVLAQLIGVQVLSRGGSVVILDRKGSHRWALGLSGVDYCATPSQMHQALVRLAALADERNTLALHEAEGWDPGPRVLVICEELNATIGQLAGWWADNRGKSDPKRSPGIRALADLSYMGRSAKVNLLAVAQMLSARAIGGPEARENFGIRCLARYTHNAWKMLVPECAMPRASRVLGRWQLVIGGEAREVQVGYLTPAQARALARVPALAKDPDGPLTSDVPGDRGRDGLLTLREAISAGILQCSHAAAKKRLQRGRGDVPKPRGKRGTADLYNRADLEAWAAVDSRA